MGKLVESYLIGKNVQQMISDNRFVYVKILMRREGLSLPWGLIHVYDLYFQASSQKLLGQTKPN